jgi:hypothetical protein
LRQVRSDPWSMASESYFKLVSRSSIHLHDTK